MEKQYSSYETLFICDLSQGGEAVRALVAKFVGLIADNAKLTGVNEWGKRRMAYPINDLNDGYYVLATFNGPHDFPAELERIFNITEGILRAIVIKTEDNDAEEIKYVPKTVVVEAPVEKAPEESVEEEAVETAEVVEEAPAAEENADA